MLVANMFSISYNVWCNCFRQGRKHCGKRRKCWLPAFSLFPTMFSTGFYPQIVKLDTVWKRVEQLVKHHGFWKNTLLSKQYLLFSTMFLEPCSRNSLKPGRIFLEHNSISFVWHFNLDFFYREKKSFYVRVR